MRIQGNPALAILLAAGLMAIVALIAAAVVLICRRNLRAPGHDADGTNETMLVALLVAAAFGLGLFVFYVLFG